MDDKRKNSTLADLKITRVFSGGEDITSGGKTFSSTANFSVTGPGDSLLQLLIDDGSKYNGQTNAAGNGFFLLDNLPEGKHEYVLSHGGEESDPFVLTSVVTKPFIEKLEDSTGVEVENGGQTEETDLKIKGLAKTGQIRIFNGAVTEPIATFTVKPDRSWDGSLTLVTGQVYALKAKADDRAESDLYTVTIGEVSEVEVKITSLKDTEGSDVENGGTTADTTLTISGSAKDGEVKLLNGANTVPIATFTATGGAWGGEIQLPAGQTYVLRAQDVDNEESETYTVTVSETSEGEVKITSLKDSNDTEIANGGSTTDTTLTISGSAKDGEVKLLNGANTVPIATFTATGGAWGGEIQLPAGQTYVLKAQDVDNEESETYTVTVSETPEGEVKITSLKDSNDTEIATGGSTTDTALKISGSAKDGVVTLLDGVNDVPAKTFMASEGIWAGEFELAAGHDYVLTAESVDGSSSEPYSVTVSHTPEGDVRITGLSGETGEVEHESVTPDTQLTIVGTATSSTVEVFDNDGTTPIKTIPVVEGQWSDELDFADDTKHVLTAKAPGGTPSKPFGFFIGASKPPEITGILEDGEDGRELKNGDETSARIIWLRGNAKGHFQIVLWNGDVPLMRTNVSPGGWEDMIHPQPGEYKFIVKTRSGLESEVPFNLKVVAPEKPH